MALTQRALDTELIRNHHGLIMQLEAVYMDRIDINQLLKNMQKQFAQRRENIQEIISNQAATSETTNLTNAIFAL